MDGEEDDDEVEEEEEEEDEVVEMVEGERLRDAMTIIGSDMDRY